MRFSNIIPTPREISIQGETITLDSNYENPNNTMNRLLKDFKSPENPTSITANKNLSKGKPWETWFPGKLNLTCENFSSPNNDCSTTDPEFMEIERGLNSAVVGLPDVFHWKANGYANSWWLDLDLLKKLPPKPISRTCPTSRPWTNSNRSSMRSKPATCRSPKASSVMNTA